MAEENLTKRCSLCHCDLSLSCFYKMGNGLRPECKACRKLATRADYLKRKTKILQYNKDYRLANLEATAKYQKSWRQRNRLTLKQKKAAYAKRPDINARSVERNRQRRHADPKRSNGYSRKWRLTHPEQRKVSLANNKLKRRNVKGTCSPEQWIAKCEYHGWQCYLCGTSLTAKTTHMEHRKPLSRGGSHWPANLAPVCVKCNLSKNNKTESEFRALLNCLEPISELVASSP